MLLMVTRKGKGVDKSILVSCLSIQNSRVGEWRSTRGCQ